MTVKRFQWVFIKDNELELRDNGIVKRFNNERLEELLNELNDECEFLEIDNEALTDGATKYAELYHKSLKENEELKTQLQNTSDQRDEFHRGARENANRVGKLEKENEQLKQFKEDVFNNIDMHLRMLPTARDNEFNEDDGDPSLYTGAIYMLETLKKELDE